MVNCLLLICRISCFCFLARPRDDSHKLINSKKSKVVDEHASPTKQEHMNTWTRVRAPAVTNCPHLQRSLSIFKDFSTAAGGVYASTLSPNEDMGQVLLTKGCFAGGVALNALNDPAIIGALLHFGVKLPSATHLANHIPLILNEEVRKITCDGFVGSRHEIPGDVVCRRVER